MSQPFKAGDTVVMRFSDGSRMKAKVLSSSFNLVDTDTQTFIRVGDHWVTDTTRLFVDATAMLEVKADPANVVPMKRKSLYGSMRDVDDGELAALLAIRTQQQVASMRLRRRGIRKYERRRRQHFPVSAAA